MNITDYRPLKETKSHFDSDFLYNTYPCSIPLDFAEVPLHWHNEMELIYIKKGRMIVSVDLEYSVVNAGDIVVVMPGHIHSIIQNESDSCEYENILFNLDMLVSRQRLRLDMSDRILIIRLLLIRCGMSWHLGLKTLECLTQT